MAAPSTSNIYFGQLPSFYNSNISSINPCSSILIGDFVVLNKNHEYDSWDNTGSDFYNKGPPTECLSVGGDAVIENKLGIGTSSPVENYTCIETRLVNLMCIYRRIVILQGIKQLYI
jgi:hypothetical protein